MNKLLRTLELDPEKEYIILVRKDAGLSPEQLNTFPKRQKVCIFLLVDDVNQVKLNELDTFQKWIDKQREQLK